MIDLPFCQDHKELVGRWGAGVDQEQGRIKLAPAALDTGLLFLPLAINLQSSAIELDLTAWWDSGKVVKTWGNVLRTFNLNCVVELLKRALIQSVQVTTTDRGNVWLAFWTCGDKRRNQLSFFFTTELGMTNFKDDILILSRSDYRNALDDKQFKSFSGFRMTAVIILKQLCIICYVFMSCSAWGYTWLRRVVVRLKELPMAASNWQRGCLSSISHTSLLKRDFLDRQVRCAKMIRAWGLWWCFWCVGKSDRTTSPAVRLSIATRAICGR